MSNVSKCNFCNSVSFGPGCPFTSHKRHFHAGDSSKCCWCGSVSLGPNCPFNPFGPYHVHGVDFNAMMRDSVEKTIVSSYLIEKLSSPITEMKAYKLGLIDKNGNRIRKAVTTEEINSFTYLDEYIINIRQSLGNKVDMINSTLKLQIENKVSMVEFAKLNESTSDLETKIKRISSELKQTITSAYSEGLSTAMIEKLIFENMLKR